MERNMEPPMSGNRKETLICPRCNNDQFVLKYEASHIYSYIFDSDAPGLKNSDEFLSFLYDRRELTSSDQYVECQSCGSRFPCSFNVWDTKTSLKALQEAISGASDNSGGNA